MWSWPVTRSIRITVPSALTCISKRGRFSDLLLARSFQCAPPRNAATTRKAPIIPPITAFTSLAYRCRKDAQPSLFNLSFVYVFSPQGKSQLHEPFGPTRHQLEQVSNN